MIQPGRKYETKSYRYSINGQEKEKELNENITSAEFWMYDSRIARRWNVDPIIKVFESPYAAFANNPIWFADPNGNDSIPANTSYNWDRSYRAAVLTLINIEMLIFQGKNTFYMTDDRQRMIDMSISIMNEGETSDEIKKQNEFYVKAWDNEFSTMANWFGNQKEVINKAHEILFFDFCADKKGNLQALMRFKEEAFSGWEGINEAGVTFGSIMLSYAGTPSAKNLKISKVEKKMPKIGVTEELPQIGTKLEFVFGKATGSAYNIGRSKGMLRQLEKIGIFDNEAGRSLLKTHLESTYKSTKGVLQSNGRHLRESFLMGPNGGLKVKSVWKKNKLITVEL